MTAAAPVEKRVDTLRRAAEKARTLADAANPSPWQVYERSPDDIVMGGRLLALTGSHDVEADVAHIASWHPDVARAAADMLEEFARLDDQGIHPPTAVVTLAKRYLGETS